MKRILITSAGGAPALNFIRSLRDAPEEFYIVGVDANKYTLQRSEADKKFLVPRVEEENYIPILKEIMQEERIDFLHCQMSYEMETISDFRDELGVNTLLPSHHAIETCENKFSSYTIWEQADVPVPATCALSCEEDLIKAFDELGPRLWIREVKGSAGKGALPTSDFAEAAKWINDRQGWGRFTAAELLDKDTVTWQSLWFEGQLIAAQGRKRLYWEFSNRAPSGVTGVTGTGVTVNNHELDMLAQRAILAIDGQPHGIFGVDITYDHEGHMRLTEINIGRFFTTHYFFTKAGMNFPYYYVKLGCGEGVDFETPKINPLPADLAWIRGMDCHPTLISMQAIDAYEQQLQQRIKRVRK